MIPYLTQPRLEFGGHTFYAFGFLVAIALLTGAYMVVRRAQKFGIHRAKAGRLTMHMLLWGYLGSHVLYLLLFQTADLARRPWRLLNPLDGIYSFGGLICGLLAARWFAGRDFRQYIDIVGFVFPFSWTIARAGCALAHDHVGAVSTSWIAVQFPTGARLDLGLIEMLFTAVLSIAFLLLDRRQWRAPFFSGLFLLTYGAFRLWMDTLQNTPATFDRWFACGAILVGCAMLHAATSPSEKIRIPANNGD